MSKYKAKPIVIDGIRFASQKEGRRYQELKLLERAGEIHGLRLQPRFTLSLPPHDGVFRVGDRMHVGGRYDGIKVGDYRADFEYCECRRGGQCQRTKVIVEDVKGFRTPLYRWKKKHTEIQYGIQIREL